MRQEGSSPGRRPRGSRRGHAPTAGDAPRSAGSPPGFRRRSATVDLIVVGRRGATCSSSTPATEAGAAFRWWACGRGARRRPHNQRSDRRNPQPDAPPCPPLGSSCPGACPRRSLGQGGELLSCSRFSASSASGSASMLMKFVALEATFCMSLGNGRLQAPLIPRGAFGGAADAWVTGVTSAHIASRVGRLPAMAVRRAHRPRRRLRPVLRSARFVRTASRPTGSSHQAPLSPPRPPSPD
jgi:hypothetical protein